MFDINNLPAPQFFKQVLLILLREHCNIRNQIPIDTYTNAGIQSKKEEVD